MFHKHPVIILTSVMSYLNPILPGFNPDPSIIRVDSDFFLVTSTIEYFPGAPIYHSRDLIKWTLIGHALTRPSQLQIHTPEPGGGVWATTIRYHSGKFYIDSELPALSAAAGRSGLATGVLSMLAPPIFGMITHGLILFILTKLGSIKM